MKQNSMRFGQKQKFDFKKIFFTLMPKFVKGLNKSWLKFHSFCMIKSKLKEFKGPIMLKRNCFLSTGTYLIEFLQTLGLNLAESFGIFHIWTIANFGLGNSKG